MKKLNLKDPSLDSFFELEKSIIKNISEYFVNNYKNFIILKYLIDGEGISLKMIDYYCHKYEKDWYSLLCQKYHTLYSYNTKLSCFIKGEKVNVFLNDMHIYLNLNCLLFYKHLFEDKVYEKIIKKKDILHKEVNIIWQKAQKTYNKKKYNNTEQSNNIKITFKTDDKNISKKILFNSAGLKLAPCSYCDRKPGFYEGGINYCWFHWDQKNKEVEKIS
jgi:hypothetical protein